MPAFSRMRIQGVRAIYKPSTLRVQVPKYKEHIQRMSEILH